MAIGRIDLNLIKIFNAVYEDRNLLRGKTAEPERIGCQSRADPASAGCRRRAVRAHTRRHDADRPCGRNGAGSDGFLEPDRRDLVQRAAEQMPTGIPE